MSPIRPARPCRMRRSRCVIWSAASPTKAAPIPAATSPRLTSSPAATNCAWQPPASPSVATADVQVDSDTRVDAQLQIGQTFTTVTVTGGNPLLKTDRADVSNTLTSSELGKLPILDRNITTLLLFPAGSRAVLWSLGSLHRRESAARPADSSQRPAWLLERFPARWHGESQQYPGHLRYSAEPGRAKSSRSPRATTMRNSVTCRAH